MNKSFINKDRPSSQWAHEEVFRVISHHTTIIYLYSLTRMTKMKKMDSTKCSDVEEQEFPYIADVYINFYHFDISSFLKS